MKRVARHLDGPFIVTYGDGLADVDIGELLAFHRAHGRLATVTTVRPLVAVRGHGPRHARRGPAVPREAADRRLGQRRVSSCSSRGVLDYLDRRLRAGGGTARALAEEGQLVAYRHDGFWQPMDTYRESTMLNEMWDAGKAPWKVW